METTTYETTKEQFASSCEMMVSTLEAVQAHMAVSSKSQREISLANHSLKTQLKLLQTKYQLLQDEMDALRQANRGRTSILERLTECEGEVQE